METTKQQEQLDISRSAVAGLVKFGRNHQKACIEGSYSAGYWDGYIRALEHVLEAEQQ